MPVLYDDPILYDADIGYDGGEVWVLPGVLCQAAFGVEPFTRPAEADWVTLGKVESLSTDVGREREEGRTKTGTARLVVRNDDRSLDPTNSASPYYPDVVPGCRLRLIATWAGVTYYLFTGYVEDWPQTYESSFSATVDLQASDAFAQFAAQMLAGSVWATEVMADAPSLWLRLGDASGTLAADSSGHGRNGQYHGTPTLGASGLIVGDDDKAVTFPEDSRVSLPYKTLLSGYPFTIEAWFLANPTDPADPAGGRIIWSAHSGPVVYNGPRIVLDVIASDLLTVGGRLRGYIHNGTTGFVCDSSVRVDDGRAHHVVWVVSSSASMKLYVDGVDVTTSAGGGASFPPNLAEFAVGNAGSAALKVPSGGDFYDYSFRQGTLDEVLAYSGQALSAARVADHYIAGALPWAGHHSGERLNAILDLAGYSGFDRDIDTGSSRLTASDLSGSVLDAIQQVAESEDGLLFMDGEGKVRFRDRHAAFAAPYTTSQGTFGDTDAELPYEDLEPSAPGRFIRNDIRIKGEGSPQIAADVASQDRYGHRTHQRGPLLIGTSESTDLANYLLARYKDPHTRFATMVLEAQGVESTLFPQMLGRKIGDRVTVVRRPPGGGPNINLPCHIEGISHDATQTRWRTTWALSPADTSTYWILGTAALGTTTRLAY